MVRLFLVFAYGCVRGAMGRLWWPRGGLLLSACWSPGRRRSVGSIWVCTHARAGRAVSRPGMCCGRTLRGVCWPCIGVAARAVGCRGSSRLCWMTRCRLRRLRSAGRGRLGSSALASFCLLPIRRALRLRLSRGVMVRGFGVSAIGLRWLRLLPRSRRCLSSFLRAGLPCLSRPLRRWRAAPCMRGSRGASLVCGLRRRWPRSGALGSRISLCSWESRLGGQSRGGGQSGVGAGCVAGSRGSGGSRGAGGSRGSRAGVRKCLRSAGP